MKRRLLVKFSHHNALCVNNRGSPKLSVTLLTCDKQFQKLKNRQTHIFENSKQLVYIIELFVNWQIWHFCHSCTKLTSRGFKISKKKLPPLGIELTTPTPLLESQQPYPFSPKDICWIQDSWTELGSFQVQ